LFPSAAADEGQMTAARNNFKNLPTLISPVLNLVQRLISCP
jgi:hypothetical protein